MLEVVREAGRSSDQAVSAGGPLLDEVERVDTGERTSTEEAAA